MRLISKAAEVVKNWSIIKILTVLSHFGILIAISAFVIDLTDRTEERIARHWGLLALKACGNSGKREAIEYLVSDTRFWFFKSIPPDRWPFKTLMVLPSLDLSRASHCTSGGSLNSRVIVDRLRVVGGEFDRGNWEGISLVKGELIEETQLNYMILRNSVLSGSNIETAFVQSSDLRKAILRDIKAKDALFSFSDLRESVMWTADFSGAFFEGANLAKVEAWGANFTGASFPDANLADANFSGANFASADLFRANISNAVFFDPDDDFPAAEILQDQIDDAWAWSDQIPKLPEPLIMKNLCDPTFRSEWERRLKSVIFLFEKNRGKASASPPNFEPPEQCPIGPNLTRNGASSLRR